MYPGNERVVVTECVDAVIEMSTAVVDLERRLQQLRKTIMGIEVKLSQLAIPVPEGYTHAPGCVQRWSGWHTCDPVLAEDPQLHWTDCRCVVSCADDPDTACSLSGEPHVHPDDGSDTFGRCPVHPDAPGDL